MLHEFFLEKHINRLSYINNEDAATNLLDNLNENKTFPPHSPIEITDIQRI